MSRTGLASLAVLGVAALALAGCAQGAPMPTPTPSPTYAVTGDGTLRIGSIVPTGESMGAAQVAGIEAAIREINEAGGVAGVPVQSLHRNSGDPETQTAEDALNSLVTAGVDVIVGPSTSAFTSRLAGPAAAAGVPLISPAVADGAAPVFDSSGFVFRTAGSFRSEAEAFATALDDAGVTTVALVYRDGDSAKLFRSKLRERLELREIQLVSIIEFSPTETDFASIAASLGTLAPGAVIVADADQAQSAALLTQLAAAELGGPKLWLAGVTLADYTKTVPAGALDTATGVRGGAQPDEAFIARLTQADPGLTNFRAALEAYDATILAALAAVVAGDDGGPAIARLLPSVSRDGITCTSFGACLDVLRTEPDINYDGASGSVDLNSSGDVSSASWGIFAYGPTNAYTLVRTVVAG